MSAEVAISEDLFDNATGLIQVLIKQYEYEQALAEIGKLTSGKKKLAQQFEQQQMGSFF